jgi:hypothetical protein
MAKQGQHKHDIHDHRLMPAVGHNNPRKTTPITASAARRRRRRARAASAQGQATHRTEPRAIKWSPDTRAFVTHEADSQARAQDRAARSGSDSNADAGTRGY